MEGRLCRPSDNHSKFRSRERNWSVARIETIQYRVIDGEAYDQLIGEGNVAGNAVVQAAIDPLVEPDQIGDPGRRGFEVGSNRPAG